MRFILLLLIVLLTAACQATAPPEADSPFDPAEIAEGKRVYDIYCVACHGANLEGEPEWKLPNPDGSFRAPPHDASGHTWHHSDGLLTEIIKKGGARIPPGLGSSNMPAYEGILTDAEIAAVLAYFKSSWPPDILAIQQEMTAREQSP
jgi:mono/diheme cytochrome c family protein